ncbi:uncharacterized protein [Venturia canescens]|uniref:uncharacterized protein isoform X2 n=1 Tax=Venturia canescens TaxID=32260 RepID=UPI001C9D02E0|nr:uncharacterized protein LOC122417609 isoform X2 [Venturia canescens]
MDKHQEGERERGRTSRASSTSSLGREVRCACQFFQSDSLLPERRAMIISRPSSRNANQPASIANVRGTTEDPTTIYHLQSEHEYEPIGTPLVKPRTMTPVSTAPVVRIIDTDVAPVADSDDSIDLGGRFTPGPVLEGNELILPLDGQIEDSAMETKELAGGGDTSEELESPQQLQDRLEERFLNTLATTAANESRVEGKVYTSKEVDPSTMMKDASPPSSTLQRGAAHGLPQRLRFQADKLRSRLKSIQPPNFTLSINRSRPEKTTSRSSKSRGSSDKKSSGSRSDKTETSKRSRIERIRSSLPDRPRLSLPDRRKFHFPERSKFHLPDRPRFNIKKPNVHFPTLGKSRKTTSSSSSEQQQQQQPQIRRDGTDESSAAGSMRKIFDFSTYPRLFDKKSKIQEEYATSSPKESRAQSIESSTLPRTKKTLAGGSAAPPLGSRWSQKFTDMKFADDEEDESGKTLAERSKPWRRPSLEEPRVSLGTTRRGRSIEEPRAEESLPWSSSDERIDEAGRENEKKRRIIDEQASYEEEAEGEKEFDRIRGIKLRRRTWEESYEEEDEPPRIDPRLYGNEQEEGGGEDDSIEVDRQAYRAAFAAVDPRYDYNKRVAGDGGKLNEREGGREASYEEQPVEEEENEAVSSSGMDEDISARSDQEQQRSSGSSFERRRRGIIEDIDSEEFIIRQEETALALAHEILITTPKAPPPSPPERPARTRSLRKRKEPSVESYEPVGQQHPIRPKRDVGRRSIEADYDYEIESMLDNGEDSFGSGSRHKIVYHAESTCFNLSRLEPPLDDSPLVVVKPIRRKSRSSTGRSESLAEGLNEKRTIEAAANAPSAPPRRRKRVAEVPSIENGFHAWNGHHFSAVSIIETANVQEEKIKMPAPKKPERAVSSSREAPSPAPESSVPPPPVPPKRSSRSRSRGASLAPDDDRTSHGAESLPEIGYTEEDIPQDEEEKKEALVEYPGYATIEKREKPPRPPPLRKRREGKFATTPRTWRVPDRPHRAYSTLRPVGSSALSETTLRRGDRESSSEDARTAYEPVDSEREAAADENDDGNGGKGENGAEEREKQDPRGIVVSMIQGRPLPAPPRPPRSRRDKDVQEQVRNEVALESSLEELLPAMSEAFASTQTDPLPDDMIIEEEITRAKLVVTPSRSGSQILVSTERIPSPAMANFSIDATRSFSQGGEGGEEEEEEEASGAYDESIEIPNLFDQHRRGYSKSLESTMSFESSIKTAGHNQDSEARRWRQRQRHQHRQHQRHAAQRSRTTTSPERDANVPIVPPLPSDKRWSSYRDEIEREEGDESRSASPALLRNISNISRKGDDYEADVEARLQSSFNERIRLEEELERARNLRSSLLTGEPLKIASLEVTDLRVESLNVTNLETQKLTASEIDATIVSASEISKKGESRSAEEESASDIQPTLLLRELIAIRSQLELVNSGSQEAAAAAPPTAATARLQLDQVSRTTETRAIYSSLGRSREASPPQRSSQSQALPVTSEPPKEFIGKEVEARHRSGSTSRSRSSSPGRTETGSTRLRQTASPVKSLPPVISVTPDTPDSRKNNVDASSEITMPQRAVLSYVQEESLPPPPPPSSITSGQTRLVAFTTSSQIPAEFLALASSPPLAVTATSETATNVREPDVLDLGWQLAQALRIAIKRAMRHFVGYIVNRIGHEDTDTKMREIEIALCALLLIIVGLLIICFSAPRTITHHHHWDYFNPPRL